jgi:hypothetical protein
MRVASIFQKINIPEYSAALLCTESRKTCTNLAENMYQTRDALYEGFRTPIECKKEMRTQLVELAQKELIGDKKYLIFDDSRLSKPHARNIEGLDVGFDGSSGRAELGLQMITALITDLRIRIPIDLVPFFSKQIVDNLFKAKGELAAQIFLSLRGHFNFEFVVADAHYATKFFIGFLGELKQNFLMKFSRNRVVTISRRTGQLKKMLRLKRNEHFKSAIGSFDQHVYYFYVVKLNSYATCYFISLNEIQKGDLVSIYKIRWNIELYHRTAKQSLGWKDCQMRSIERQELHSFYVMYAYAIADIMRVRLKLETTENAIRKLWRVKSIAVKCWKAASVENFCYVA